MTIRIFIILFLLVEIFLSAGTGGAQDQRPLPGDLQFQPLVFSPPAPEKVVLKNGITLFLLEDHELPVLDITAFIKAGSMHDPDDKISLAKLTASVMRTGGTASMSGDEIDEKLEFIAGQMSVHANHTNITATLSILIKDQEEGLKIFADVLMNPLFHQGKMDLAQKAMKEEIRRRNDDPEAIAEREFNKLVFAGHPFGREPTLKTVSAVQRADLLSYHQRFFQPRRVVMSISGDFSKKEMVEKMEAAFKDWKQKPLRSLDIKPIEKKFRSSVNHIDKETSQSVIRIGHLGEKIFNPDHYALKLMSDILGGNSFQSRLVQDIRTDRGLAYSVWSYFGAGLADYDIFAVGAETKAESTSEVINLILANLRRLREELVSSEELENAKQFIENSFIFKFDTSAKIASRKAYLYFYKVPETYLETYLENIRKVTREQVLRVAQEYLHPEGLIITVVGDQGKFRQPLDTFGEVRTIPLEKFE